MTERLVTAAYAFIPGKLNAAHAAGTYVPADICHRLYLARGLPSRFVTGLDVHGRHVGRMLAEGADPEAVREQYATEFQQDLATYGVQPTDFVTTDDTRIRALLDQCIAGLRRTGRLSLVPAERWVCDTCGDLSGSEVVDDRGRPSKSWGEDQRKGYCARCERPATCVAEQQWGMALPRDGLVALEPRQPFPRVRRALRGIGRDEFSTWVMTRSRYHGTPMTGDPERALYLWADSLVSKLLFAPDEPFQWCAFFGKNILHYYSLVLPTMLTDGLGMELPEITLSARGFCTSPRGDALATSQFLSGENLGRLRFAMAWVTPDDILDFELEPSHLHHVAREVLDKVFLRFLRDFGAGPVVEDADVARETDLVLERSDRTEIRRMLLGLEVATRRWLRWLRERDDWAGAPAAAVLVYNVLNAVAPGVAQPPLPGAVDRTGTLRLGEWLRQPLELTK